MTQSEIKSIMKKTETQILKAKLEKLRKDLKGKQATAAKHFHVNQSHISRVLNGEREDIDLLNQLVQYRDDQKTELNSKFKQFIESV